MATTTEDGFHEIQLNGKQLVFLFMAIVVVSVVIFLCGVLVGRGVRGDRGILEALSTSSPSSTGPSASVAAPASPPSGAPTGPPEELSYPKRLAGGEPARETLSAAPPAAPAARAQTAPAAPAPRTDPVVQSAAPAQEAAAGFSIQVAALRQRAEADSVARTLSSKGYPAYVMPPDAGAPAVFRVRVGKFKDRREAESVAARLEKEEQFKPWIVR